MLPSLPRHQLAAIHIRAISLTSGWIKATWRTAHNSTALRDRTVQPPARDLSLRAGDFHHSSARCEPVFVSFHEVLNNAAPQ